MNAFIASFARNLINRLAEMSQPIPSRSEYLRRTASRG